MKHLFAVTAAALALAASPALAQSKTNAASKKAGTAGRAADQSFVMDAANGGMAEVELGKLAVQKASNDDVKKFGQRMVDDHTKANDDLKAVAASKNITLPKDTDAQHKALVDRLSKLSGPAFDRAYLSEMLKDHRKDVNDFKKEASSGRDPEVKAFASKTLPTLEEHLSIAQSTDKVVGTTGKK